MITKEYAEIKEVEYITAMEPGWELICITHKERIEMVSESLPCPNSGYNTIMCTKGHVVQTPVYICGKLKDKTIEDLKLKVAELETNLSASKKIETSLNKAIKEKTDSYNHIAKDRDFTLEQMEKYRKTANECESKAFKLEQKLAILSKELGEAKCRELFKE